MGVVRVVKRFEVWSVTLEPTKGSEIQKTRPCLVVSPNEMNVWIRTVIIAPFTSGDRPYTSRVTIKFRKRVSQVAIDQLRCVDKIRLVKRLGIAPNETCEEVSDTLVNMFKL